MTGEIAGDVMENLLNKGALDVFYTPIYMKKNRPAIKLSVICGEEEIQTIQEEIFRQTTTIGVRMYKTSRECMNREHTIVSTKYGDISIKQSTYNDIKKSIPEFDDCKKRAREHGIPVQLVYNEALKRITKED